MTERQDVGLPDASMRCPFLVETAVLCCRLAPYRKLVPAFAIAKQDQCCSSDVWRSCEWARKLAAPTGEVDGSPGHAAGSGEQCPFLDETIACSCAAAPVKTSIPRTQLAVSRCLGDSHRYCETFLDRARPRPPSRAGDPFSPEDLLPPDDAARCDGSCVALAPNHMWLDIGPGGSCHVGVDAFLARVTGPVDEVTFLSACGPGSPSLALTVADTILPLVFSKPFDITGANTSLRRHPGALVSDPYGRGWLYEGKILPRHGHPGSGAATLRRGAEAAAWMASEVERLTRHLHATLSRRKGGLGPTSADGGAMSGGLAQQLRRAELLEIYSLFFTGGRG